MYLIPSFPTSHQHVKGCLSVGVRLEAVVGFLKVSGSSVSGFSQLVEAKAWDVPPYTNSP